MDTLSITVSILTILGTGGVVAQNLGRIRRLRKAPTLLLQLNNEITDLELLVHAVEETLRENEDVIAVT